MVMIQNIGTKIHNFDIFDNCVYFLFRRLRTPAA